MLQGTSSDVGKSILATALCRIFKQDQFAVTPFKSQNMALNSYITADGGEIGRAQAVQAFAAEVTPTVDMNPILLKPSREMMAEVIVHGKTVENMSAKAYRNHFIDQALQSINLSLQRLQNQYDVIVIEGAGSPAEINLKDRDIANMKIAELADAKVVLVADIDRGGVFASIVGTLELLSQQERDRIIGFIINKFRGDIELLQPGLTWLEERTGKKVLGVVPYITNLKIEAEDSLALTKTYQSSQQKFKQCTVRVGVIQFSKISNFTDFDCLQLEAMIDLQFIQSTDLETNFLDFDAIILPGTKNTMDDLYQLQISGIDRKIIQYANDGGLVIGICGGYQILGKHLYNPHSNDSEIEYLEGLGLIPVETRFEKTKITQQVVGEFVDSLFSDTHNCLGKTVKGFEIHTGRTEYLENAIPLIKIRLRSNTPTDSLDGCRNQMGNVFGSYFHGIFDNDIFRRMWINYMMIRKGQKPLDQSDFIKYEGSHDYQFDQLANIVRENVNIETIYQQISLYK
ncbi:cobyric acid synthase CobQ [Desulfuribacillus stibiiarsenatis]|uniref:Cobyric acid synthase n=2 Tax=Desulfuribacillus stibiiarsenatis TaxID=1390249 RepID=A0A1E5L3X9_9FIRM|nr:cobyric acid synthase CobQ [Desulfuribacillus stibiiarsenatis]